LEDDIGNLADKFRVGDFANLFMGLRQITTVTSELTAFLADCSNIITRAAKDEILGRIARLEARRNAIQEVLEEVDLNYYAFVSCHSFQAVADSSGRGQRLGFGRYARTLCKSAGASWAADRSLRERYSRDFAQWIATRISCGNLAVSSTQPGPACNSFQLPKAPRDGENGRLHVKAALIGAALEMASGGVQ
jgi:hypothetical protein